MSFMVGRGQEQWVSSIASHIVFPGEHNSGHCVLASKVTLQSYNFLKSRNNRLFPAWIFAMRPRVLEMHEVTSDSRIIRFYFLYSNDCSKYTNSRKLLHFMFFEDKRKLPLIQPAHRTREKRRTGIRRQVLKRNRLLSISKRSVLVWRC